MGTALALTGVSKTYRSGGAAYGSLRESLARRVRGRHAPSGRLTALAPLDLALAAGETVGLIGANGAGKSTLLKLAARITAPDTGRVEAFGPVSSLIELGAGFHPELTGRENVFLHGAILGRGRRDMRARLGDIAAFAELGARIDAPVKYYSTGMIARLGFAVAVHVDPRVLLVDEVLSVGDEAFRARCHERIARIKAAGTGVLYVSHDLPSVDALCDRALWLAAGAVRAAGDPAEVTAAYRAGP